MLFPGACSDRFFGDVEVVHHSYKGYVASTPPCNAPENPPENATYLVVVFHKLHGAGASHAIPRRVFRALVTEVVSPEAEEVHPRVGGKMPKLVDSGSLT